MKHVITSTALVLLMTACSGPPSNEEAEKAYLTLYNQSGMTQLTGSPKGIRHFEVSDCIKAEGKEGFNCHMQGELVLTVMGHETGVPISTRGRYSRVDGKWRAHAD